MKFEEERHRKRVEDEHLEKNSAVESHTLSLGYSPHIFSKVKPLISKVLPKRGFPWMNDEMPMGSEGSQVI